MGDEYLMDIGDGTDPYGDWENGGYTPSEDQTPLDFGPVEGGGDYAEQVLAAFAANPDLQQYVNVGGLQPFITGMPSQMTDGSDPAGSEIEKMVRALSGGAGESKQTFNMGSSSEVAPPGSMKAFMDKYSPGEMSMPVRQEDGALNRMLKDLGFNDSNGNTKWSNVIKALGTIYFGNKAGQDLRGKQQLQVDRDNIVMDRINSGSRAPSSNVPHTGLVTGMGPVTGGPLAKFMGGQ